MRGPVHSLFVASALLGDVMDPLSEDGVHPTAEGHVRLADAVADWLSG